MQKTFPKKVLVLRDVYHDISILPHNLSSKEEANALTNRHNTAFYKISQALRQNTQKMCQRPLKLAYKTKTPVTRVLAPSSAQQLKAHSCGSASIFCEQLAPRPEDIEEKGG